MHVKHLIYSLFLLSIFLYRETAYSVDLEQAMQDRQAQVEQFFENIEQYSEKLESSEEIQENYKYTANIISFYTLSKSLFKMIDEITMISLAKSITNTRKLGLAERYLTQAINEHPMNPRVIENQSSTKQGMFHFFLMNIEPYGRPIYESPFFGKDLVNIFANTKLDLLPKMEKFVLELNSEYLNDTPEASANIIAKVSLLKAEEMVFNSINQDFVTIWGHAIKKVDAKLKKRNATPLKKVRFEGNNWFLRKALEVIYFEK